MIQTVSQLLLTILGGVITGGVGLLLSRSEDARKKKNLQKLLIVGICDDLELSLQLYDKVAEEFEKSKVIWLSTLNELRESRQTYKNNKDFITLFDDEKLRIDIFRYYNRTGDIISTLEYQQKRRMVIEDNFSNAVHAKMSQNPELKKADAEAIVLMINEAEAKEYQMLTINIPATIHNLKEFKTTAIELIRQLKDK
ncbi:MAG: hypothetical protein K0R76_1192 [Alphaproteobacteria bacterium]|jgi:hypothetical protein|nr:hypothetical protein [Alphaproteobacteria bacterium]